MAARTPKRPARDARYRNAASKQWWGIREETHVHIPHGESVARMDLCLWWDGTRVLAERLVLPDLPDAVMAEVLEEALARPGIKPPRSLGVQDVAMQAALKSALGDRFLVQTSLPEDLLDLVDERVAAMGDDLDRRTLPVLAGSRVDAVAVDAVISAFHALVDEVAWTTMGQDTQRFVMALPAPGLSEASVWVHGENQSVSISRTTRDRADNQVVRGARSWATHGIGLEFTPVQPAIPQPVDTMDEDHGGEDEDDGYDEDGYDEDVFDDDAPWDDTAQRAETDARGWWRDATHTAMGSLRADDVDGFPRPLCAWDVAAAALVVEALRAWYRQHGVTATAGLPPRTVDITLPAAVSTVAAEGAHPMQVTVMFEGAGPTPWITDLTPEGQVLKAWMTTVLPEPTLPFPDGGEVERLRRVFLGGGPLDRAVIAREVVSHGPAVLPALVSLLSQDALWVNPEVAVRVAPWILVSLVLLDDPRVRNPVLQTVIRFAGAMGPFTNDGLAATLAALGPAAFPALAHVARSALVDALTRRAAGMALYRLAVQQPTLRGELVDVLMTVVREALAPQTVNTTATLLFDAIARTHNDALDQAVRRLVRDRRHDPEVAGLEDYEDARRDPAWSPADHEGTLDDVLTHPSWDA